MNKWGGGTCTVFLYKVGLFFLFCFSVLRKMHKVLGELGDIIKWLFIPSFVWDRIITVWICTHWLKGLSGTPVQFLFQFNFNYLFYQTWQLLYCMCVCVCVCVHIYVQFMCDNNSSWFHPTLLSQFEHNESWHSHPGIWPNSNYLSMCVHSNCPFQRTRFVNRDQWPFSLSIVT